MPISGTTDPAVEELKAHFAQRRQEKLEVHSFEMLDQMGLRSDAEQNFQNFVTAQGIPQTPQIRNAYYLSYLSNIKMVGAHQETGYLLTNRHTLSGVEKLRLHGGSYMQSIGLDSAISDDLYAAAIAAPAYKFEKAEDKNRVYTGLIGVEALGILYQSEHYFRTKGAEFNKTRPHPEAKALHLTQVLKDINLMIEEAEAEIDFHKSITPRHAHAIDMMLEHVDALVLDYRRTTLEQECMTRYFSLEEIRESTPVCDPEKITLMDEYRRD